MTGPEARASRVVLTIGTFDILHYGHVAFLRECAMLGGSLVVGVNTDNFARGFKVPPVMSQEERVHAVQLQGYAARLNDSSGRELIARVRPAVVAIGTDWAPSRGKDYLAQVDVTQDWLDENRIIVAWVPYVQGLPVSTSDIRRRVLEAARG